MINNIWFKITAGKINKIPKFYTIFAGKMPDYGCHETPHRPHRPQIQRYLTLNKQQE